MITASSCPAISPTEEHLCELQESIRHGVGEGRSRPGLRVLQAGNRVQQKTKGATLYASAYAPTRRFTVNPHRASSDHHVAQGLSQGPFSVDPVPQQQSGGWQRVSGAMQPIWASACDKRLRGRWVAWTWGPAPRGAVGSSLV
eukprot:5056164-Prymnesium_polylepis.1